MRARGERTAGCSMNLYIKSNTNAMVAINDKGDML
jgi:hypothetical protein